MALQVAAQKSLEQERLAKENGDSMEMQMIKKTPESRGKLPGISDEITPDDGVQRQKSYDLL